MQPLWDEQIRNLEVESHNIIWCCEPYKKIHLLQQVGLKEVASCLKFFAAAEPK